MLADVPPPQEIVCRMSDEMQRQMLQNHFHHFYKLSVEQKLIPQADCEEFEGVKRCQIGIDYAFMNAVWGTPKKNAEAFIEEQIAHFKKQNLPFVWYVEENDNANMKEKLLAKGFHEVGIFRGVIGPLDKVILQPALPEGYTLERVSDDATFSDFNRLVTEIFEMKGKAKEDYTKLMKNLSEGPCVNWVVKKQGKVVSALTTFFEGDLVSFWNGATASEERRHGLSTAIRRAALHDATKKGCKWGASYLMSEGMAYGICNKLGYETKWRFNVYLAP